MANWTPEQKRAIDAAGDILVSAGAGSGKTAVLTERIVRLVREGLDIRRLLCATFTNAAANEMKKRIERALGDAAQQATDETEAAHLNEAARESANAAISTLHSFCTQILRRHFSEAGLDPNFRVADESETALMREQVWDELCEARLPEGESFALLLEALGSDDAAFEAINELHNFLVSLPEPLAFLDLVEEQYGATADELEASPHAEALAAETRRRILFKAATLAHLRDAIAKDCPNAAAFIDEELLFARGVALQKTFSDLAAALGESMHPAGGRISYRNCPEAPLEPLKRARRKLKNTLSQEAKAYARGMDYEAKLIARQRPLMLELCAASRDFMSRFSDLKREKSVIDYGDMEQLSLALLRNDVIAAEYRRRFQFVFMDEYQDCNAVQEEIIGRISTPGTLFLVGDVKQSIYRFRSAEPALFLRRYLRYADSKKGLRIDLNANFRSSAGVIDAVNAVFARLMRAEVAELDYDKSAALAHARVECGAQSASPAAEFIFADLLMDIPGLDAPEEDAPEPASQEEESEEDADAEPSEPRGVVEAEALLAAARIREIMQSELIYDPRAKEMRKPRYSDFAVLLRSYKNVSQIWLSTLSLAGVPAYGELAGGFFDAVEVRVFLELLRVIDNRRQDIPMAAVLRSPIGDFSTEEIIELRALYGKDASSKKPWSCYDSLAAAAETDTELGRKARGFLDRLARWQRAASLTSVQSLIGSLIDDTNYALFCRALPGGKQREANLDALVAKARAFEATGASGLGAFLAYADRLRDKDAPGTAQSAGADVVRVMTIHASKGLEFPYVILGGLSRCFYVQKKKLLLDASLGAAAHFTLGGIRQDSFYARAIKARREALAVAEEMRVLYVAMTRAREKILLLCASTCGNDLIASAAGPQEPACISQSSSFAAWLLGCILHSKEGEVLRARYGLPELPDAPELGIAVRCEACDGTPLSAARMNDAAFADALEKARLLPADAALFRHPYPYCADTELPSKISVTALAGHEVRLTEAPDFLLERRMSAADRGTAYHALMQRIPLRLHDEQSIRSEIERLVAAGHLSPLQAEAIRPAQIAAFFDSPVGRRLAAAETVRREMEFNINMSAGSLGLAESDSPVVLQGVVDCCFMENGSWVLLDYKTDFVPEGVCAKQAALKHARQVNLYAEALARLTRIPVAQRMIFFFALGEAAVVSGDTP